jgi:hypothetical protein
MATFPGLNPATTLNGANPVTAQQVAASQSNGRLITPSADGNGLPFTNITPEISGVISRNIITWFVPQFGTVRMFINPQNITYNEKKLITKDRTKGGYTLQYWGEELTTLNITGTTGSSGVEGINALNEIYRSEQYAFNAVGVSLAANNAAADVSNNLVQGVGGALGQAIGGNNLTAASTGAGILGGILGLNSPNNLLSARNVPSLASLAFAVEMYYNGWVFRGYFESMSTTERADNFLWDYNIQFTVTQRRGYRTNYFPWHESPVSGPSSYTTPYSFNGYVAPSTNAPQQVTTSSGGSINVSSLTGLL